MSRHINIMLFLAVLPLFSLFSQTPLPGALQNYRMGRDLEAQNRMTEAEVYYGAAVRISTAEITRTGGSRDAFTALTWTLRRQQKYADVITWGERGLRLFSDEHRIVEIMGEAYFYQRDYDNSLRFMQRYLNSMPEGEQASAAYLFAGEIFRLTEKYRLADIAYTMAVRLQPGMALWWYRLGNIRENTSDFAQAAAAYERALRLNPNYREASEGLARSRARG